MFELGRGQLQFDPDFIFIDSFTLGIWRHKYGNSARSEQVIGHGIVA